MEATVRIRRGIGDVKEEVEYMDGRVIQVSHGWTMGESDQYPGEEAYIIEEKHTPISWIASGDLVFGNI